MGNVFAGLQLIHDTANSVPGQTAGASGVEEDIDGMLALLLLQGLNGAC